MKKKDLIAAVDRNMAETHEALQTIWNNVNKGQKNKIRKIPECGAILDRYGVVDEST